MRSRRSRAGLDVRVDARHGNGVTLLGEVRGGTVVGHTLTLVKIFHRGVAAADAGRDVLACRSVATPPTRADAGRPQGVPGGRAEVASAQQQVSCWLQRCSAVAARSETRAAIWLDWRVRPWSSRSPSAAGQARDQSVPREHVAGLLVGARRRVRQRLDPTRRWPTGRASTIWRQPATLAAGVYWNWEDPSGVMSGSTLDPAFTDAERAPPHLWMSLDEYLDLCAKAALDADWRQLQLPPESVGAARRVDRARRAAGAARREARLPGALCGHR